MPDIVSKKAAEREVIFNKSKKLKYNRQLSLELYDAYERSQVSQFVLSELIGVSRPAVHAYLNFRRNISRSDIERRVIVAIKLLNQMVDEKILPVNLPKVKACGTTLKLINDYIEKLEAVTQDRK